MGDRAIEKQEAEIRNQKAEGRSKEEGGRRKKEEGRRKKTEGGQYAVGRGQSECFPHLQNSGARRQKSGGRPKACSKREAGGGGWGQSKIQNPKSKIALAPFSQLTTDD
ncbi:MAG: hypothetical protein WB763_02670 [Terriglobia bacterium]